MQISYYLSIPRMQCPVLQSCIIEVFGTEVLDLTLQCGLSGSDYFSESPEVPLLCQVTGRDMKSRGGWSGEQRAQGIREGKTLYHPHSFSALPAHLTTWELLKQTDACLTPDQLNWNFWVLSLSSSFFLKNSFPCWFFFNGWSRLRTTGSRVALQGFQKHMHIRKEVGEWRPTRMGELIVFYTLEAGTTFMQIPSSLHSLYSPTAESIQAEDGPGEWY